MNLFDKPIQIRFETNDSKIQSYLNDNITDEVLLTGDLEQIADETARKFGIICDTEFSTEDSTTHSYLKPVSVAELPLEQQVGARYDYYEFVAVDYTFKVNGDYTFFFDKPTIGNLGRIEGVVNANNLTLTIITRYTRIPLSDEWQTRVKDSIKTLVSEVETRINLLKEECKEHNAGIKPNVLSVLEKERQNLIEKKAHDAKLNPFK